MSRRQQEQREVPAGEHTNADLLRIKSKKGIFFSEAVMLHTTFELINRTNHRKYGHADQRKEFTIDQIKKMKKEGNSGYADKTLVKFW